MEKPYVFNIQRYSIHDGDGIRTTVFFKGCPLRCRWCHNPESQRFLPELLINGERCAACGACAGACPAGAVEIIDGGMVTDRHRCALCGKCADVCPTECREIAGRPYGIDELANELMKDSAFYEQSGGGVTLSGGEVMAQPMEYVAQLMKRLWENGLRVNIDTCGAAPYDEFKRILPYTDTFLYDLKEMNSQKHREYTGVGNEQILGNLRKLSAAGARISLRLPLIEGVNANDRHTGEVIGFLKSGVHVGRIHLLPYHNIGRSKYPKLGRPYDERDEFSAPSDEKIKHFVEMFKDSGFPGVVIGG